MRIRTKIITLYTIYKIEYVHNMYKCNTFPYHKWNLSKNSNFTFVTNVVINCLNTAKFCNNKN